MPNEKAGYQDYAKVEQHHEYRFVPGVVQVPLAQRTAGHRLIRLHGGYGERIVTWESQRMGRPPTIPTAEDLSTDTLLGHTITPSLPRPNETAAGFDWRVSGTYTYAQNTARVPGTDAFPVGLFPFILPVQDSAADALSSEAGQTSPSDFTAYYNALGDAIVDKTSGNYIWPFLALPTQFSETLI